MYETDYPLSAQYVLYVQKLVYAVMYRCIDEPITNGYLKLNLKLNLKLKLKL